MSCNIYFENDNEKETIKCKDENNRRFELKKWINKDQKFLPGLDYLYVYNVFGFSTTLSEITAFHHIQKNNVYDYVKPLFDDKTIIIDLTACIGGVSLSFTHYFPNNYVISVEIDKIRAYILKYHINKYHSKLNTPNNNFVLNMDSMKFVNLFFKNKNTNTNELLSYMLSSNKQQFKQILKNINEYNFIVLIDPSYGNKYAMYHQLDIYNIIENNKKKVKNNKLKNIKTIKMYFNDADNKTEIHNFIQSIYNMNKSTKVILSCPYNYYELKKLIDVYGDVEFDENGNKIVKMTGKTKTKNVHILETNKSIFCYYNTYDYYKH